MNPHIFREYDIRGKASELTDGLVRDLGRALGTFYARRSKVRIAVGHDCRTSSPRLRAALTEGLLDAGVNVVDLGMVPTPLMYFSVWHYDLDGGVEITGSHNPPEDNGFKMMCGKDTLAGEEIRGLRKLIEDDELDRGRKGSVERLDPLTSYASFMKGNIRLPSTDLRFAVDAGNGAGGPAALRAFAAVGLDPEALLCTPDGTFPNHHPDPSLPENLEFLRNTVRTKDLALGIAYDGDADRIGVIDDTGQVIFGDKLLIALGRAVLKDRPGAAILGEVKCSQTLYDDIAKHGGRPILWKTGHSLIKRKMKEEGALLAGEMSGHVFFADRYYGFDDAIYASLRLVELLAETGRPIRELLEDVPKTYATPEIRVECSDEHKFAVVEAVRDHFGQSHAVIAVDGARVLFDGGWGLVRASNTQPVLVLRFEANSEEKLAAIRETVEAAVASATESAL
ncbi:MAG: phosphomannomutase/phosphoglucomutase [Myxococcota bacterium]